MNIGILIPMIFVMTISGTFGAMFFKKAIFFLEKEHILRMLMNPYLYLGGICYLAGAVLNIILLKFMDYSILYPMTSLTYVWTLVVSYVILKEKINKYKVTAVFLIVVGVIILNL